MAVKSESRSCLFVVPPMVLDGDYIDYPWAADMGALYCAARAVAAGWRVDVFDSLAQADSGWHVETSSGNPDSDVRNVTASAVASPESACSQVVLQPDREVRVAGIPFHEIADRVAGYVGSGDFTANPDIVVVVNHPFLWESRHFAADMTARLAAQFPGSCVVLADCAVGGMLHVERSPDELLNAFPGIRAVVAYSGETVFADPAGLIDRIRAGETYIKSPAAAVSELPMLSMPLYESIDIAYRHAFNVRFAEGSGRRDPFAVGAGSLPMLASAGCAHECVFCTSNPGRENNGPGAYRTVPVRRLEDSLYLMKRAFGCRRVVLLDDAANLRSDFKALLELLNRAGLDYEFPNGLRADRLDDESISLMKGHVTTLSVSCETADGAALRDRVGKSMDPSAIESVAASARRHGVPLMVHFIIGFPWETLADVRNTLDFARKLHETHGAVPAVQFATPVRGSRLFSILESSGLPFEQGDAGAFQHRPSFVPAAMQPGELEAAMLAFNRRMEAARPTKVIVNLTYECINSCEFCAVSNRVRKSIPKERVFEIIEEHRQAGIRNVDFDGGEPLLHPGVFEIVSHARAAGYEQVNVTSNGRKLADPEVARALVESGVTSVLISLHADTAEIHDSITGKSGSFRETVAGIDNMLAALALSPGRFDFGVNVTVCMKNLERIVPLTLMMAARGVPKMNFQFLTPFGAAGAGLVPDPYEAARAVSRAIDAVRDRMRIYVVNAQMCLFEPGYESFLLNDLQKLGRTMVFVWEEEVNLFNYLAEKRVRIPECAGCPHYLVCDGFYSFPVEGEPHVQ